MTIRHDQDGTSAGRKRARGVLEVWKKDHNATRSMAGHARTGERGGGKKLVMSCHGRTDSAWGPSDEGNLNVLGTWAVIWLQG
jgi:hypothetical protein